MKYIKLLSLILLSFMFSQTALAYEEDGNDVNEEFKNIMTNDDLLRKINTDLSFFIEGEVDKSLNDIFQPSMFIRLMMTYIADDSTAAESTKGVFINSLDNRIKKGMIHDIISHDISVLDRERLKRTEDNPVIAGFINHTNSLEKPVTKSPAIEGCINVATKNVLEMRDVFLKYIIGFVIFGIVFHFAFRLIVSSKTKGKTKDRNSSKSMYVFIEAAVYIILIIILSLLIKNEAQSTRSIIAEFITNTYSERIMYSHQGVTETPFYKETDSAETKNTSDDEDVIVWDDGKYNICPISLYGYSIKYPKTLTEIEYADNNAGCIMHNKDNSVTVTTFANWNVLEKSIEDLYKEKYYDGSKVTYKRLFKNRNYYIKSGYAEDGRMYYLKECIVMREGSETVIFGMIEYPKNKKKEFDAIINDIFTEFPTELEVYTTEPVE